MYKNTIRLIVSCSVLLTVFTGCAATGPNVLDFSLRRVSTSDRAKVIEGAEKVLTDMGFVLVRRDPNAGVLVYSIAKTPTASTYRFTSNPNQRRIVEVRIQSVPNGHKVFARVSIQRQTSRAHRAFAFGSGGDDRPGHTPIDRGAATTTVQNTVWRTVRRDKPTEQEVLTAITDRIDTSDPPDGD